MDVLLPVALDDRLRSARGRRSLSQVVASALCLLFDEDPRRFGLPHRAVPRRPGGGRRPLNP